MQRVMMKLTHWHNGKLLCLSVHGNLMLNKKDKTMRTYTIELRCDFDSNDKYDAMLEAMRELARNTMATALMLKDKRDPQVAFKTSDMFSKDDNLEILTPEDALPRGE